MSLLMVFLLLTQAEGMVAVPSGWFDRGCTPNVDCPIYYVTDSPRTHTYLSTFYIDRYSATAAEFAEFLNDQGEGAAYVQGQSTGSYWIPAHPNPVVPWYPTVEHDATGHHAFEGYENYPANTLSWFGAAAYCAWKGKRLPTEAEWEKAARGTDFRLYPWGNQPNDPMHARHMQDLNAISRDTLMPVDALPEGASAYGALNMAGNVWNWVSDWYSASYYTTAPDHDPQGPPAPVSGTPLKVMRGGSAVSQSWVELTTMWRTPHEPWVTSSAMGVRCALSGPQD